MSYSSQLLVGDNASSADFWAWGSALSTFLGTTLGWTKTDSNVTWGSTAVPTAGTYVYEVWTPGTATFQFWMKVEYGNSASNTCPMLRISFATGPSTAGTLSGNIIGPFYLQAGNATAETTGTQFECDMTGDAGNRFGLLMWRNAANANRPCCLVMERNQNGSGVYGSTYLTVCVAGYNSGVLVQQQSLYAPGTGLTSNLQTNFASIATNLAALQNLNSTPFLPVFPLVTSVDFPLTNVGVMKASDLVEGQTYSVTLYGGTAHNFVASLRTNFNGVALGGNSGILMRAD